MDWLLFVRGRSFQRVGVLDVEHELTSLVLHGRPRGYDARVSLRCQLNNFELGIQRVPGMHFFQEPTRGARKRKKHVADEVLIFFLFLKRSKIGISQNVKVSFCDGYGREPVRPALDLTIFLKQRR